MTMFFHTVTASVLSSSSVDSEPLLPSSVFLFTIHFDNAIALTSWQRKFNTSEDYLRTIFFFVTAFCIFCIFFRDSFILMKKWCILIDQTKTDLTTPHQEFWQKKKGGGRKEPVWKQLNSIIDCPKYTCASYAKSISNCRSCFAKNRKWFVLDRS